MPDWHTAISQPNEGSAAYFHGLFAVRLSSTVLALIAQAYLYLEKQQLPEFFDLLENMVKGGADALPPLTKWLSAWGSMSYSICAVTSLILIALMWSVARRTPTAVWLGFTATILPLTLAVLFRISIAGPLFEVVTRFNG